MGYEDWKSPRSITMGALLAVLASIIQASALYLPLLGISLCSISTLFVALSGYLNAVTGMMTYLISAILLLFWGFPHALVFMCSSGLLGLCLGVLLKRKYPIYAVALISSVCLSAGLLFACKLLGIPLFPWLTGDNRLFFFPVLMLYSLIYTIVWIGLLSFTVERLKEYVNI